MIRRRPKRGCLYVLVLLLLCAHAAWLLRAQLLTAVANFLVEDDGPQKADAIVVLSGDEYGTRTLKGAQLAQAGYAPYVIVSGPKALLGPQSEIYIEYARRQGYPASLFRSLPHEADSTRGETAIIGQYLQAHGIKKILLVTSNYHTRRAARLMRVQNRSLDVIVVAAPDPYFIPDRWWKTRTGQKLFALEWFKTIATWVGY